jgi:23S rRNA pseudouridine1911/1915/1917 synthase
VVHPAFGNRNGTLINALLHHLGIQAIKLEDESDEMDTEIPLSTATATPQYSGDVTVRPGLVHRLDKDTTGLMVIAKNDVIHAHLAKQFHDRTITRRYKAIVWGVPNPPEGSVETHLGRDKRDRKLVAVVPENQGKYALTHYKTLDFTEYHALLEFKLATGRTHQIRVHAKHLGHTLLGDVTYGGNAVLKGINAGSRKAFYQNIFAELPRQALHAYCLGFVHPHTQESLYFEVDLPEDMQTVWRKVKSMA